jgi:hypothetical protein
VVDLAAVKMDFHYDDWFAKEPNVGYETLIYDVMIGDPTLFMRADMVEQAGASCSRCSTPGRRMARPIRRPIRREAQDRAKRMRFWRETTDAGEASAAMTTDNRHEPRAPAAIQMFGRDFGCRRHVGH